MLEVGNVFQNLQAAQVGPRNAHLGRITAPLVGRHGSVSAVWSESCRRAYLCIGRAHTLRCEQEGDQTAP
eukprot:scaffold115_cov304-Prasinococcus_capsulatus_cf.AAC.20